MERIFHLDLKGAPLKLPYLEKVMLLAKSWGATGVLLEWEDTFPYTSELAVIGSKNNLEGMYSLREVMQILQFATKHGLEVIQLVQAIGHMEFVLKHNVFRELREVQYSPAVLCPCKENSQRLVRRMLEQILEVQPDMKYLHIGADEVWHTAVCSDCQYKASTNLYGAASLFLDHIRDLALFLKEKRPSLTILIWDDMLRSMDMNTLRAYQLGDLVQPVVWNYNPKETFVIDPILWTMYWELFPKVWAGSAYKGANGSCQIASPVTRYTSNHEAWIEEINKYSSTVNFAGIILTGWSRFDHYATLCELMPVALPSLASCLRLLTASTDTPYTQPEAIISEWLPFVEWPGEELARSMHSFVNLRERCVSFLDGDVVMTWLNPWQIEQGFTNPLQVQNIAVTSQQLLAELSSLSVSLRAQLGGVTGVRSVCEWVGSFVTPLYARVDRLAATALHRADSQPGAAL